VKRGFIVPVLAAALAGFGCHQDNTTTKQELTMKTDLQELTKRMAMPVAPRSVHWIQGMPGKGGPIGPNDSVLTALLEYSNESMEELKSTLQPPSDQEPVALNPKELELFFPGTDTSKWEHPSPGLVIVPGELHSAAPFAKSPFLNGKAVILQDKPNTVLVALFTS
jgi:hypothetical protein